MGFDKRNRPLWCVIDASNHVHRYFHAAGDKCQELTETLIETISDHFACDRLAVCFDSPMSFRRKIDATYKANRSVRPATVGIALAGLRQFCLKSQIDVVECDSYEADDCMATLARMGVDCGARVILCGSDKDLHQCLVPGLVTQLVEIKRSGERLFTNYTSSADVRENYGITTEQWCDYQCLVGEKGDNVTGADGIGGMTAAKILRSCGSIEKYYENPWAANLTAKQMAAMAKFRGRWKTVEQLIRLCTTVPIGEGWAVQV